MLCVALVLFKRAITVDQMRVVGLQVNFVDKLYLPLKLCLVTVIDVLTIEDLLRKEL